MRKICFTLAVMLLLTMLSPVVFAAEQTYGIDNLNNESGDLVIAYLGGSITEGAGATGSNRYATQLTNRYFKTKYPNKNVIEVNAGVGGTPLIWDCSGWRRTSPAKTRTWCLWSLPSTTPAEMKKL